MAEFEIVADRYVILKTDNNLKNKIQFVSGTARYQKWVEEDLVNQEEAIKSTPESTPRIAGGYADHKNAFGQVLHAVRGENYYMRNSVIIRFRTPIDFVKAKAVVSHNARYYEYSGDEMDRRITALVTEGAFDTSWGSTGVGKVFAVPYDGVITYGGAEAWADLRTPRMPIWDSSLPAQDMPIMSWNWEEASYKNDTSDVPRAPVGYSMSGGEASVDNSFLWDNDRFINRITDMSFGRTSEDMDGPSDEFFGYNKVDYNDAIVDWNNPGDNWNPNAVRIDYIIRVESRQYYKNGGFLFGWGMEAWARRYVSTNHTLTLYADNLRYEDAPFNYGTNKDYSYEYQNSEVFDVDTYVGNPENKATKVNADFIINQYQNGKQVIDMEWKVDKDFLNIGDVIRVKNKYGWYVGGTNEDGTAKKSFRVVHVEDTSNSTYSQRILAKEI